jgi:UDP:flavonoid glycosyltransferase YjiC (YdhE family)
MKDFRVLFGVLDWGLGHATRSIPVIHQLLQRGCQVRIATSGLAYELLKSHFPELVFYKITPYGVRYARHGMFMMNIFWQLPRLLRVIWREGREAKRICARWPASVILSDCRYGFRAPGVMSVFITHQINFQMPLTLKWLQPLVNLANRFLLGRFARIWVPDVPAGITGKLSAPGGLKPRVRYIGTLSRFKRRPPAEAPRYEVAAVLSGPEPQRSLLEKTIRRQLETLQLPAVLVRGLPAARAYQQVGNLEIYNYLDGDELLSVIGDARVVIARSGYSTVMDLMELGCHAVFVPTPGQTEQLFLARQLMKQGIAYSQKQSRFHLETALKQSRRFRGFAHAVVPTGLLSGAIDELLTA